MEEAICHVQDTMRADTCKWRSGGRVSEERDHVGEGEDDCPPCHENEETRAIPYRESKVVVVLVEPGREPCSDDTLINDCGLE